MAYSFCIDFSGLCYAQCHNDMIYNVFSCYLRLSM
nr:MAG TPA: hypothetical protein [Bacteriophage sp.]